MVPILPVPTPACPASARWSDKGCAASRPHPVIPLAAIRDRIIAAFDAEGIGPLPLGRPMGARGDAAAHALTTTTVRCHPTPKRQVRR